MAALAPTRVLPEDGVVRPLSALGRRSYFVQRSTALDPKRALRSALRTTGKHDKAVFG